MDWIHNTQRGATEAAASLRCICPRGLFLAEQRRQYKAEYQQQVAAGAARALKQERSNASYLGNYRPGVPAPDLSKGLCGTPLGQLIGQEYGARTPRKHREMCAGCPVQIECLEWALAAEQPAGAWEGMYGGHTASERRKIVKQRSERREQEPAA
jgi:Transcription factor WhiB